MRHRCRCNYCINVVRDKKRTKEIIKINLLEFDWADFISDTMNN